MDGPEVRRERAWRVGHGSSLPDLPSSATAVLDSAHLRRLRFLGLQMGLPKTLVPNCAAGTAQCKTFRFGGFH